jgi:hypothetical protein
MNRPCLHRPMRGTIAQIVLGLSPRKMAVLLLGVALLTLMLSAPASAQRPVAVVEDVVGAPDGVALMDYVVPGTVIRLKRTDNIVLGYFKSCTRESIIGGTVTVGTEQSDVTGGNAMRMTVNCDADMMQLTAEIAAKSASMAIRSVTGTRVEASTRPQFTLYGLCPVVTYPPDTTVVIERIDVAGERYDLGSETRSQPRAFYDFADSNKALVPGGLYRASAGSIQVVFRVDPGAKPGRTPVIGRLLQLGPET